jgi:hypothetical protein
MDGSGFGQAWIDAWNRRDIDTLVGYFADDARIAAHYSGCLTLPGKEMLRSHWCALARSAQTLRCTLKDALWNVDERALTLFYCQTLDEVAMPARETLRFGPDGLIRRGEVLYGGMLDQRTGR